MSEVRGYSPLDIQGAVAFSNAVIPDYARNELLKRQAAVNERNAMMQQAQEARLMAKQQAEAEALAEQQRQQEELIRDPSPTNIFNYNVRNPSVANEMKASWELQDSATRKGQFQERNEIYMRALNDPKDAAAYLRQRSSSGDERDAADEALADMLDGDLISVRKAYAKMGMAVMATSDDPVKTEEALRKYYFGKTEDLAGGDLLQNQWGDVALSPYPKVDSGPAGFYPYQTPEGIPIFGGGTRQAPGAPGAAPGGGGATPARGGGLRTGGWTPRSRDGGDNSDAAVDGKLSVIQTRTGLAPDSAITGKDVGRVYDAIVASEGTNSVGARNNNGGNIVDGKWARSQPGYAGHEGRFAKFSTPEAGRQAGMKLLAQKLAKGHNTVRDVIEGKVNESKIRSDAREAIAKGIPRDKVAAMAAQYGVKL